MSTRSFVGLALGLLLGLGVVGCEPVGTPRDVAGTGGDGGLGGGGGGGGGGGARYHPVGFDQSSVHGPDMKLGVQDCRQCHGDQLDGGTAGVSCDACHLDGWREDCTYCHGGDDDNSGAPPRDIDGSSTNLRFPMHHNHLDGDDHQVVSCDTCHVVPTNVLSDGHVFDATPARSEVTFSGRAAGARYDGAGGCSNVACHGNGSPGSVGNGSVAGGTLNCESCHPTAGLTGRHRSDHPRFDCSECHADAQGNNAIAVAGSHNNGTLDFASPDPLLTVTGSQGSYSCTGWCHGGGHFFRSW